LLKGALSEAVIQLGNDCTEELFNTITVELKAL